MNAFAYSVVDWTHWRTQFDGLVDLHLPKIEEVCKIESGNKVGNTNNLISTS